LNLETNLRTRSKNTGTYVDTESLANGEIRNLKSIELSQAQILSTLRNYLDDTENATPPWRLIINLRGQYEFVVDPEYRDRPNTLILRVL
jgi:hypothetical protein